MSQELEQMLFDPTIGKLIAVAASVLLLIGLTRFLQRTVPRYIKDSESRYRARKILNAVAEEIVGSYVPTARKAWDEMVQKFMIEDARTEPMISLIANDNWMEFTVRYVVDYKRRRGVKDLLFTRILEEVEKTKGNVALASATFELVDLPPVDVRLRGKNKSVHRS